MSTSFRILLPAQIRAEMVSQARAAFPNECCGLLAGKLLEEGVVRVEKSYPLVNALDSPVRYESEPQGMFAAMRDMRQLGLEVLAVYHSHPTSHPLPSRTDLECNYSPEVANFIISLKEEPPDIRAWWLTATDYRPVEWEVEES